MSRGELRANQRVYSVNLRTPKWEASAGTITKGKTYERRLTCPIELQLETEIPIDLLKILSTQ